MSPYRDWVIHALNTNMHFDQFAIEQVAGDMLPNPTNDQKIATGFLRNSIFSNEGGVDPEENNWNMQLDRATTSPPPSSVPPWAAPNATTTNSIPSRRSSSIKWWPSSTTPNS